MVPPEGFFAGGVWFNFASLMLTALGSLLGAVALLIALWQLGRTRRAAEAAQSAAEDAGRSAKQAAERTAQVVTLVDLTKLCSTSSEIVHLIRSSSNETAVNRAHQLRRDLVRARESAKSHKVADGMDWQGLVTQAASLHKALEKLVSEEEPHVTAVSRCRNAASDLDEELHTVAAHAEVSIGERHANT